MRTNVAADILVVDDEADIRDLVAGVLTDEDYSVRVAADAEAALASIKARKPALLVLDIWMQGGGMDGLELLDLVKTLDPDLPVVMISGHGPAAASADRQDRPRQQPYPDLGPARIRQGAGGAADP